MKLFKHSNGMLIAFGFDMRLRTESPHMICWNDPMTGDWEPTVENLAGNNVCQATVDPEFVRELGDGTVVAFQHGLCIEMIFTGQPYVWQFSYLGADK